MAEMEFFIFLFRDRIFRWFQKKKNHSPTPKTGRSSPVSFLCCVSTSSKPFFKYLNSVSTCLRLAFLGWACRCVHSHMCARRAPPPLLLTRHPGKLFPNIPGERLPWEGSEESHISLCTVYLLFIFLHWRKYTDSDLKASN
ncbi:unnamed protein product [Eretmochelys imbricata]